MQKWVWSKEKLVIEDKIYGLREKIWIALNDNDLVV